MAIKKNKASFVKCVICISILLLPRFSLAGGVLWQFSDTPDPWYGSAQEACADINIDSSITGFNAREIGPSGNTGSDGFQFCYGMNSRGETYLGPIRPVDCRMINPATYLGLGLSCILPEEDKADKEDGPTCNGTGNPCDVQSGKKFQTEVDFNHSGISFSRTYNSRNLIDLGLGNGWRHNYQAHLVIDDNRLNQISNKGRGEIWRKVNGVWQGDSDSKLIISETSEGYELVKVNNEREIYSANGQLLKMVDTNGHETVYTYTPGDSEQLAQVTNQYGHSIKFGYTKGRLSTVTDEAGSVYKFEYDNENNLSKVILPDTTPSSSDNPMRVYHYENNDFPSHLTGITDENRDRYATWSYDSDGKAISSEHAQTTNIIGQEKVELDFQEEN